MQQLKVRDSSCNGR